MLTDYTLIHLPYSTDLIDNYQALLDLPGFALLESVDRIRGRYDILTACPYDTLVMRTADDLHWFVERFKAALPSRSLPLNLPFQGGALGFFSYDLGCALMGIPVEQPSSLPGTKPLAALGFYDWAIITDHQQKTVQLFAANSQPATRALLTEVLSRWHHPSSGRYPAKISPFIPLITREQYRTAFTRIQQALQEGRCYQANYTQPFLARYEGRSWDLYTRIRHNNPVPFAAYLKTCEGDIVSFSPERFMKMENGALLASPIKGTERRSPDPAIDEHYKNRLLASEKNRAENVMIVDMMRNDFSKIAKPGTVNVSHLCDLQSFAAVHHLVSDVEAQCREGVSPVDAFLSCFPGASITGAPKRESMRVIAEQEHFRRGVYCGSIGYFSAHGRLDTNIAIRTLLTGQQQVSLSAGGGIVIDSNCEEEYQECFTKIAAISRELEKNG
ncbi:para-aminobenzoate synthase, component I [Legionella erythra]|uniref:aminodeoxychorismate synthase n=1 Tax=Legionella erythra TaxID=448 RepID=A0A0W0TQR3_LEGER|nr:para-aminobenzoate synthase, component I [Legionella erythra]